jgi:3',5'-nucleoside bisphosphate phosphatase
MITIVNYSNVSFVELTFRRITMGTIDLHIHTTASDGTFTPKKLVDYGIEKGLRALAITDHDTMRGVEEALDYVEQNQLPLEIIPGMEISTDAPGFFFGIHILAYFPDRSREELKDIVNNCEKDLRSGDGTPQDAIKTVTNYGGITSLGHPQEYGLSLSAMDELVKELAGYGLRGVEGIYTTHSASYIKNLSDIAEKYGLIVTGGSDFHGARKPGVDLGSGFGDMVIPYHIVDSLKNEASAVRS